jgi:hypothetical protein
MRVEAGRSFDLGDGFVLREDVRIAGGPYGVAYITPEEREAAGKKLPRYNPESGALSISTPAEDAVVLILHDVAYRFDASGQSTTETPVAAESAVSRDVGDFLVHVVVPGKGRPARRTETPPPGEKAAP